MASMKREDYYLASEKGSGSPFIGATPIFKVTHYL